MDRNDYIDMGVYLLILIVGGFVWLFFHSDQKAEEFEQNVNEGKEMRLSENEKSCEAFISKLASAGYCLKKVDTISKPYFFILSPCK